MAGSESATPVPPSRIQPIDLGLGRLFERARDAVVVGDALSGRVVLWNDAASTLFGYTAEEAPDLKIEMLVPDPLRDQHRAGLARYAGTGRGLLIDSGKAVELPAVRKDGSLIEVELTLSPLEGGEPAGRYVMAIIRDVTQRTGERRLLEERTDALERSQAKLTRALDDLRAAHDEVRDMTAIAAHELASPLSAVVGFSTLLQERWASTSEAQKRTMLDAISRQAGRLSKLADDLLTTSRLDAGSVQPKREPIAVEDVFRESLLDVEGAESVLVSAHPGLRVLADPEHVERIIVNLIRNAIKHGSPPIRLAATVKGRSVDISVCDEGAGVPDEIVPRLFGRFVRGDAKTPSTGLGLSIVRGLARANGGEAWFEPNEPNGSCFRVRLPKPDESAPL